MRRASICAIAALLGLGSFALAQQDFSDVEIKTTHVVGNVYMLEGAGGNIGVSVGKDGVLIVDDQFAPLADRIRAAFKGLGSGNLEFVLNTHWHGDHTGGNEVFGPDAPIIAHTNVRKRLATRQEMRGRVFEPRPAEALPVITFDQSLSIHFNGEEIKAVHFPRGHTDGDTVVFFTGSNVVHMGDDFFSGRFPFVDLDSGGNVEGLIENIGKVITDLPPDVKIIPGHGRLSGIEELKRYHRMLKETSRLVREGIGAGKTLEELQQEGLSETWASWGSGFVSTERWIDLLYRSYSAN